MKRFVVNDTSWHDVARSHYLAGHSRSKTLELVRQTHEVSDRMIRQFFKEDNLTRNKADAQRLKRFNRNCVSCHQNFDGRTPTVLMCDSCVGEDHHGASFSRMKKYQRFRKINSYGIDVSTFERHLHEQDGRCGLCRQNMKSPCIDHDHATGEVRGLLCHRCNLILGQIELVDAQEWLRNANTWIGGN